MTFSLWSSNTKQVQQIRGITKYSLQHSQDNNVKRKILMPKPLGQNICSRIKMPQWDSNQLGRSGLLEALLACCCSFHLEYEVADKGNQPETVQPT